MNNEICTGYQLFAQYHEIIDVREATMSVPCLAVIRSLASFAAEKKESPVMAECVIANPLTVLSKVVRRLTRGTKMRLMISLRIKPRTPPERGDNEDGEVYCLERDKAMLAIRSRKSHACSTELTKPPRHIVPKEGPLALARASWTVPAALLLLYFVWRDALREAEVAPFVFETTETETLVCL